MPDILVGRQPIFDRYQNVIAYELLYRSLDQSGARDGDQATMQVVLNTFASIGLERLVGRLPAFINFTRNFFTGHIPMPFPPQQVVLEVLEDIPVDNALSQALTGLAHKGYAIALDDVTSAAQVRPLLRLARFVKIDLPGVGRSRLAALVAELKPYGVKLLAEKVETRAELEYCQQLGFHYFQGYFLCKPSVVSGRRLDSSRLVLLRLLAQIQEPGADFRRLGQLVAQDVTLSYKLLRLVNSAYYSRRDEVTSIEQAIAIIGLNHLRGWLTLLQMAAIDRKPPELITIALVRARMCERLARALNLGTPEVFFLTGLLSVLDALMDIPMPEAVAALPLAQPVKDGLLERRGPAGQVLSLVIAGEQGQWEAWSGVALDARSRNEIFIDSIAWAESLMASTRETAGAPA
ncbi:MAG: HDOD domain-containing protein [Anaerolineales bacterium]|nr:HDOD domain-containing protein [Anaerolineales bacterium]